MWGRKPNAIISILIALFSAGILAACIRDRRPHPAASVNLPPTISKISNQETNEGSVKTIAFSVSDPDTALDQLELRALVSNSAVVPPENIEFNGRGSSRTVTIKPAAEAFGKSTIIIVVSDGHSQTRGAFAFTVHPVHGDGIILPQGLGSR